MGTHLKYLQLLQKSKIAIEQTLIDVKICETIDASLRVYVLCNKFWDDLDLITKKMINIIQNIPYNFYDKIQTCIEAWWNYVYYNELFIEIVKFRNKSSPYNDDIIWESTVKLNP
ncbi:10687_t:CDS:2, partial [Dentiscutata erythropus]